MAARIEAAERGSTRLVYEAKWTIFTKWCITNQVDFRAPPVKSVADFLLYLFEDRKLQPSTIDGYRSAIADKLGNSPFNISKDENLTRLLDSFHRDRPTGRRGIPSWNLSLVLHQLTKAPFEPIQEASLKHLTFKTVFLLALGSGKRRSEIHACVPVSIFQLSFQEPAGQRGSRQCGPSGYSSPGPNPGQVPQVLQVPLSGQSITLFGQDLRSQAEQGIGLCLLQERFRQGHLTCHHLLDQTNCDPML